MNAHERRTAPTAAATAAGAHLSRTARIRTDGSAAPETGAVSSPVEKKCQDNARARGGGGYAPVRDWGDTPARASGRGSGSGRDMMTELQLRLLFLIAGRCGEPVGIRGNSP